VLSTITSSLFDPDTMLKSIANAVANVRLMLQTVRLDSGEYVSADETIVGRSERMQKVFLAIGRVAPTGASVLIRGETGTCASSISFLRLTTFSKMDF
jgi:DNA-binding NtrC family response regulator